MKMLRREFYLFFAATVLVVFCALAWGRPFVGNDASTPAAVQTQPGASAVVLAGSVMRSGSAMVFRAASGRVYPIDPAQQSLPFAGGTVMVTGSLDVHTGTLHVVAIRPAA